jgi:uncharacterized membrane protein
VLVSARDELEEGTVTAVVLVLSVFAACAVEAVEALTVVLAAGVTRGWSSAVRGLVAGLLVLGVVVAALGPALTVVPLQALRLVVGGLLLVFGLQWVRKAVLRASGYKGLHDEAAIYERQVSAARSADGARRGGGLVGDWYGFTLAFKATVLEGLEVAFIVLTFGANQGNIGLAVLGAIAAVLLVAAVGVAVRSPLSRVPENTLKFAVGIMLTTFGIFWGAEGAGARWPGSDLALFGVFGLVLVVALASVALLRRAHRAAAAGGAGMEAA